MITEWTEDEQSAFVKYLQDDGYLLLEKKLKDRVISHTVFLLGKKDVTYVDKINEIKDILHFCAKLRNPD